MKTLKVSIYCQTFLLIRLPLQASSPASLASCMAHSRNRADDLGGVRGGRGGGDMRNQPLPRHAIRT